MTTTKLVYGTSEFDSNRGMEYELKCYFNNLSTQTRAGAHEFLKKTNPIRGLYHLRSMEDVTAENIWKKIIEVNLANNAKDLLDMAIGNRSEWQMKCLAVQYYAYELKRVMEERKERSANRHAERTAMKVVKVLDPDYLKETHRESLQLIPMENSRHKI